MFGEKDLPNNIYSESEDSQSKLSRYVSERNRANPDDVNFLRQSDMGDDGFLSKPSKTRNSGSQELTLSYLCDNSKLGFPEKDISGRNLPSSFENFNYKGKEVIISDNFDQNDKWVERDFLNLNEIRANSSKREVEQEDEIENRGKKPKLETLNLSLALPDVSLSLTASNASQNEGHPVRFKPTGSIQSLPAPSNNTQTTFSNDFTAASRSYSYSHQFSHNPSCSLTRNSTDNYEYSVGKDDQIWNCGEGTNGSVHSRFKPFEDGVGLSNQGGELYPLIQGNRPTNKDSSNNSHYNITTSSNNHSFFPSELPARPRIEAHSRDSRGRGSENLIGLEGIDAGRSRKISRPERIVREIISESIAIMAQVVQELPEETLALTKDYLKNLIAMPEKREELAALQHQLKQRSDLTKETLSKCHKNQLEILVSVKMGLGTFLSEKCRSSIPELVDIFLHLRCRNCKSVVPVDDCDCKICSVNEGFCSSCMCPVCLNFDCENNTCSWVGCDVCSHWCHAACGIQKNLIKSGPSLKGPAGATEMLFHCIACSHTSETFGFVKDVFVCCAKDWGLETLMKELDCVRKIFRGSEDYKGKELYMKADDMLFKLESKRISPANACNFIIHFFNSVDSVMECPTSGASLKALTATESSLAKDGTPPSTFAAQKMNSSITHDDLLSGDLSLTDLKASLFNNMKVDDEFGFRTSTKKKGLDSLESIVRIKEAEARMFQNKADDARREAEGLQRIISAKAEKLEEEYAGKLAKLCLNETQEKRRKKVEELKAFENSNFDYYNMKMRMQSEIAGLLQRMEATKKQLV